MRHLEPAPVARGRDRIDRALAFGIAIPFLYLGLQLIAAPFYPGYSFLSRDASALGSAGSTAPWIFNLGIIAVGLCEVVAAWGFLNGLLRGGANAVVAWATCVALASSALGSLNACLYPLPDPRHTEGALSILGSGVLLLPMLTSLMLWRERRRAWVTPVLALNILVWLALVPIVSGLAQRVSMMSHIDTPGLQAFLNGYQGLLQRVAAVTIFGPAAFAAWLLRRPRLDRMRDFVRV